MKRMRLFHNEGGELGGLPRALLRVAVSRYKKRGV
jgi:hypothetical protein